ncbi:hypothetical protein [Bosea sp. TAF32]|uniref:terminase small subunit-like protein n=1 Tax=Bosea sp. TAF32 TaxID=3237482 RepID=UPI003F92879E
MGATQAPKIGRPSVYSEELVEQLCYRLATGRTLTSVCDDEDMPDRITVWRWQDSKPDFRNRLTRAREESVDADLDEMRGLGKRVLKEQGLDPRRVRVALDAFDKAARLRAPRKIELTGKGGGPVQTEHKLHLLSDEHLAQLNDIHAVLAALGGGESGDSPQGGSEGA